MSARRYDAFVSAVSSEFGRARDAAAAELRKDGLHPAVQSDFVSGPAGITLLQRLHDTIRDCAEVHCIVGGRSGACPSAAEAAMFARFLPEEMAEASYTQWEFFFARHYAPERTWLYLAAEAYPPDKPAPADERPELQAQFLHYLRQSGADHATFANLGELRAEVLEHVVPRQAETQSVPAHAPHEPMHRGILANTAGSFLGGALLSLLTLLLAQFGGGFELVALLLVPALALGGLGAVALFVLYRRYETVLARHDADAREAYDALRQGLAEGGGAARVYASSLRRALDAVDRFFGDAGMADRTLFPRAFGLHTPAPLWTAPAFDRCLLLALLYPVAAVYVVWVTTGQVGPAEHAFRMQAGLPFWDRTWRLLAMVIAGYAIARGLSQNKSRWGLFGIAVGVAARLLGSVSGITGVIIGLIFPAGGLIGVGSIVMLSLESVWPTLAAGAGHPLIASAYVALGTAPLLALYFAATDIPGARRSLSRGPVQIVVVVVFTSACMVGAMLSRSPAWDLGAPLILFLGLLTFLNAPFDWAALGLTRALLRRGIELGKWWPYLLAMVDAVVAAIVIAALTAVCVLGVQAFDDIAVRSGGEPARVLPLKQLFDGIAAHPSAPQYWWAYAMLLSTMIPSLLNLMIGGASLLRGIPWLTTALLRAMPEHRAPRSFDRTWITLVLTAQVFVGAILGIAAQAFLVYVVIGLLLPVFGLDLLGLARAVAAPDLPGTLIHWVLGPPAH